MTWNPSSYKPVNPSWINNSNVKGLQAFQSQIPGLFDTSGMESSYGNMMASMLSGQRAGANAAAQSYATRQLNAGGNPVGAGFAVGGQMLNAYRQQQAMQADLQKNILASRQAQGNLTGDVVSEIARQQAARMSMLNDYHGNQQKLYQNQSQFDADQALKKLLQQQQLSQQNSQFNKSYGLDQQKMALANKEFGLKSDLGYGELDLQKQRYGGYGNNNGMSLYGVGNTYFSRPKAFGW